MLQSLIDAEVGGVNGPGEGAVPTHELFSSRRCAGGWAVERMLAGLSTRHCGKGLEPVGETVREDHVVTRVRPPRS